MTTPKLVNVKKKYLNQIGYDNIKEWLKDKNNVYIGRTMRIFIHHKIKGDLSDYAKGSYVNKNGYIVECFIVPQSPWHNPFKINKNKNREDVVSDYIQYLQKNKTLINNLSELSNKTLGCWCHPLDCHGHSIISLYEKLMK